jgi:hypothetical protein
MSRYDVILPIAGYVELVVEANNEEAAIDVAMETEVNYEDIVEWETYRHICEGNVLHINYNDADACLVGVMK